MFHCCFAADENYVKYVCVLITNIIKSTDSSKSFKDFFEVNSNGGGGLAYEPLCQFEKLDYNALSYDEKQEGFIFHIISDKISINSHNTLQALAQELSQIYPCEILVHILDDKFSNLPPVMKHPLCFRLFLAHFLPSSLRYCLYLDVDMFVFRDLRELFTLNVKGKIAGVVKDNVWVVRNAHKYEPFREFYFNSGFLFINLDEWRKQNVFEKCLEFLNFHKVIFPDQDALNYAIPKDKALVLPFGFNCFVACFGSAVCNDERKNYAIDYTRKEVNFALSKPFIVHFVSTYNPWKNPFAFVTSKGKTLGSFWLDNALQTPFLEDKFKQELSILQKTAQAQKDFENYVAFLILQCSKSFFGYLKMPFVVYKVFKDKEKGSFEALNKTLQLSASDYNLAGAIFGAAHRAFSRRKKGRLLDLPHRIYRLKLRYEKYSSAKLVNLA